MIRLPVDRSRLAMPELFRAWASTSVLYLSGVYVPLAAVVLMPFTPQPGLRLQRRQGMGSLAATVGLVTATAAVVAGGTAALFYLVGFAVLTALLAVALREPRSIEVTIGTITAVLATTLATTIFWVVSPPAELFALLRVALEDGRGHLLEIYRQAGVAAPRIEQLEEATRALVEAVILLGPALAAILLAAAVLGNVLVIRWRERRQHLPPTFGDLTRWRSPAGLVWVLIASGYAAFLPSETVQIAAWNILAIVLAVYFCQGAAIVQFYFQRWRSPLWMRALLYLAVAVEWLFATGIVLLGVFDLWGDFRQLTPRPAEED